MEDLELYYDEEGNEYDAIEAHRLITEQGWTVEDAPSPTPDQMVDEHGLTERQGWAWDEGSRHDDRARYMLGRLQGKI